MRRSLVVIGCDRYQHLPPLRGAERDAQRVFDALIEPAQGGYDSGTSKLLLSPTLSEVRQGLQDVLFAAESLDTLTIFFAGHGTIRSGSFYMATSDTAAETLALTGLNLSELLRAIADVAPAQTNFIIDACESGGLMLDLGSILKPDVIGKAGTPGLTLLAMAASDQGAQENDDGGLGTEAFLRCITGSLFIQDTKPTLDLLEVGAKVSEQVGAAGAQTPILWGLNLYGPPRFCSNPHFGAGDANLTSVLHEWETEGTARAIKDRSGAIWDAYASVTSNWNPRQFIRTLTPTLDQLATSPGDLTLFIGRIAQAAAARATDDSDVFKRASVLATCQVAMLPYSELDEVKAWLADAQKELRAELEAALSRVLTAMGTYEFALLGEESLPELFFLPLRISQLIGWAGFVTLVSLAEDAPPADAAVQLKNLLEGIVANYSLSSVSMSDEQAPYLLVGLIAAQAVGLNDLAEQVLGYVFADMVNCKGNVAATGLSGKEALTYLLARVGEQWQLVYELLARPTELLTVLLLLAAELELGDNFDEALIQLDHVTASAFIPAAYTDFGSERIEEGRNVTFSVGHDVWTIDQLNMSWPQVPQPSSRPQGLAAILASLVFPDRIPWFLLPAPPNDDDALGTSTSRIQGQRPPNGGSHPGKYEVL